ncbi:transcriptional regulator [Paenibacillus sp. PCH8]|uniref:helix-turn-helix transcriptional regulator n=1 Tax=Paenibacillus sp. PCH8 TaxID=2066524 RepID=UPI000CF95D9E|nr:helix-turn-helix transcriptional regulator [Paenibacillus sp. PCH8]PQP85198.1 transcriptional regulator [Paenibacillus sp. PCH8]
MLENKSDLILNKVYEFRVLRKMSQSDLAKVVGVSKQTIFVMEKNNYSPSLLLAYKIADFFGVSIEEVFIYQKGGI